MVLSSVKWDHCSVLSLTLPQGRSWPVLRSYDDFRSLDTHLHRCIFDRRFSCLPELPPPPEGARAAQVNRLLSHPCLSHDVSSSSMCETIKAGGIDTYLITSMA